MDVRIEGLRFERNGRRVLDIPSLVLRRDRTTAVLGPNGAGKTTLLRLIAGLERPTAGRILLGDRHVRPAAREVAYVFPEDVFRSESVRANLELGLRLRGIDRRDRAARVDEAARLLGIVHLLDRRADRLSGGEGRRVSLARALCLKAKLALLDEPLARVDPLTYARLLDDLPRVVRALGATTVLVTHDSREALRLAADLVVISDGRVLAAGGTNDVVSRPGSETVAEMLGYTVLELDGSKIAVRPGALSCGPGSLELRLHVDHTLDLVDGREVSGWIGSRRVRLVVPRAVPPPELGHLLLIHADEAIKLD